MSSETRHASAIAGQPGARPASRPTPLSPYSLKLLARSKAPDPIADVILVGDLSKAAHETWGQQTGVFWPGRLQNVDVFEFSYPANKVVALNNTQAEAIEALKMNLGNEKLSEQSKKLGEAANDPNHFSEKRRAAQVVLVGYGYGGLVCEQVIADSTQDSPASGVVKGLVLFGTPHFSNGLRQWAHIVVKATVKEDTANIAKTFSMRNPIAKALPQNLIAPEEFGELFSPISEMQRKFFSKTRRSGWSARMVSCFPGSTAAEDELTIAPEWSTVPHAFPVSLRKSYLQMDAFDKDEEKECQIISRLIERWIKENGDKGKTPNKQSGSSPVSQRGIEASSVPDRPQDGQLKTRGRTRRDS
ncbi:hypothetical protein GGR55DRAFT_676603 [Xylaria sp. FL0064]|nr:hypothetical protein GGR55DRAFT_676603 [Xylaria sp. FL0064]